MKPTFESDRQSERRQGLLRYWLAIVVFVLLAAVALRLDQVFSDPASAGAVLGYPVTFTSAGEQIRSLRILMCGLGAIEIILLGAMLLGGFTFCRRHHDDRKNLRASDGFARATLDALPAQIAILDESGTVLAANATWRDYCEKPQPQTIQRAREGENFLSGCDDAAGSGSAEGRDIAAAVRDILAGRKENAAVESAGDPARGDEFYMTRVSRFPGAGRPRAIALFENISHQKLAEQEVQRSKQAADLANAAKSAFLANMSHEIRTPMTAILGYSQMLEDPRQSSHQRHRCAQIIRRNGEHLLSLINDILDLSKIEADKLAVEKLPTELPQLISDVAMLIRPRMEQKGLIFAIEFDGPIPQRITTDPLRLKQVLINLLSNAAKFTEKGSVKLRVAAHELVLGSSIHFDVIDTGVGMDEAQCRRLFKPFSQGDESTTRRFGGTGLGLSISRRLANLLGGDVSVQSAARTGSTFSVWIDGGTLTGAEMLEDLQEQELRMDAPGGETSQFEKTVRVLLAEDGEDNRELLCAMLRDAGATVECAEDGKAAMDMAKSANIDIVLMDMQMPQIDGYTATRQLRAQGFSKPIVAITAHAMTDDRRRCLDCGCDGYLSKPIDREALVSTIAKLAGVELKEQPAAAAPAASPPVRGDLIQSSRANDEKFAAVLSKFVMRLPQRVAEMSSQLAAGDHSGLTRCVHQLRGAAGGYGFPIVTEQANRVEQSIRGEAGAGDISAETAKLINLVRRIEGYPASPAAAESRRRILLADDSADRVRLVERVARELGFDVERAASPADIAIRAGAVSAELILFSITFAAANGFETYRTLVKNPSVAATPIGLITSDLNVRPADCDLRDGDRIFPAASVDDLRQCITAMLRQKRMKAKFSKQSMTDALTGLPSETHLSRQLSAALSSARRVKQTLACIAINIDGFATFNRINGVPAGDCLLREIGRRLLSRPADEVVGRIGGDEFIVAVPTYEPATAHEAAEKLRLELASIQLPINTLVAAPSVRVAVTQASIQTSSASDLIAQASASLTRLEMKAA